MADRLIREGSPPSGLLASPVPQYWNPAADGGLGAYEKVQGVNGASRVLLYDGNGQPLLTETNPGHVVLSGSKEDVVVGTHDDSTTILANGGSRTVYVYASEGRLAEPIVYGFRVQPPAGATTGTHRLVIAAAETSSFVLRLLEVTAAFDKPIVVQRGIVYGEEYTLVNPVDKAAQATAAQRLAINNDVPLVFYYQDSTDADQANARTIRTVRLERAYVPW